jgi:osmotically-inducible protein OsmY
MLAVFMPAAWGSRVEAVPPAKGSADAQGGDLTVKPGLRTQSPTSQTAANSPAPQSGKLSVTSQAASVRGSSRTDQRLQRKVRRWLQDDPRTRPFAGQAGVQSGRVTLAGHTYYEKDRELAGRTAASVPGVVAVQNRIVVEPNADLEIAQKLHHAFSQDPLVDDAAIGVTVINRKVYLSGTADSSDEMTRVTQIAVNLPGVVAVSNGLQLSATAKSGPIRNPVTGRSYSAYRSSYR